MPTDQKSGVMVGELAKDQNALQGISSLKPCIQPVMVEDTNPLDSPEADRSFFGTLFGPCGGFVSTASFFLRSTKSSATACKGPMADVLAEQELNVPCVVRPNFGGRSKFKSKSREGETVAVTSSLDYDDDISALSAHTLEHMAKIPGSPPPVHRGRRAPLCFSPPRKEHLVSSLATVTESSDGIKVPKVTRTTELDGTLFRTFENIEPMFDPFFLHKERSQETNGTKSSDEANPRTVSTSGSSSEGDLGTWGQNRKLRLQSKKSKR